MVKKEQREQIEMGKWGRFQGINWYIKLKSRN